MKLKLLFILATLISLTFSSCGDALTSDLVQKIQPEDDLIIVERDTFHIQTETVEVPNIISRPDSFLLGSFKDEFYGGTKADVLAQLYYPVKYKYMDADVAETTADSAVVTINYTASSFFGATNSPVEFSVYELKKSLNFSSNYFSDINATEYADFSKLMGKSVETIDSATVDSRTELNSVRIKLSSEFLQRFFTKDETIFQSDENFFNFFKGVYVTTTFGKATLLNVDNIQLNLYCHYKYKSNGSEVKFTLNFPASKEVKRVNRVEHYEKNANVLTDKNLNYVCSPSNYYTKVRIPVGRLRQRVKVSGNKNLVVNSSIIKMYVADKDTLGTKLPYVANMMLFKGNTDELNTFFKNKSLPTDSTAFITSVNYEATSATTLRYFYSFDGLAKLIESEIKKANGVEYLDLLLVPVKLKYSSSSSTTVSEVIPSYSMEGAAIYSGKNNRIPMKMEVVFSGF